MTYDKFASKWKRMALGVYADAQDVSYWVHIVLLPGGEVHLVIIV